MGNNIEHIGDVLKQIDLNSTEKNTASSDTKNDLRLANELKGNSNDTIYIYKIEDINHKKGITSNLNTKIASDILKELNKFNFGKAKTNTLNQLNSENIIYVLEEWNKLNPKKSLEETLAQNWSIDAKALKENLLLNLIQYAKNNKIALENINDIDNINDKKILMAKIKDIQNQIIEYHSSITTNKRDVVAGPNPPDFDKLPKTIDPNDYSIENLKKKYPDCKVEQEYGEIFVTNKSGEHILSVREKTNNKIVITKYGAKNTKLVSVYESGKLTKVGSEYEDKNGNPITNMYYFENGNLKNSKLNPNAIANNLYNDITATNKIGFPTTGKDIEKHIKDITPDNVIQVLNSYKSFSGDESLVEAIFDEIGIDANLRAKYVMHIKNMLIEYAKNNGVYTEDLENMLDKEIIYQRDKTGPMNSSKIETFMNIVERRMDPINTMTNSTQNGKIDKDFRQGHTGNCGLVASIKTIANNPKTLKILNSLINVDKQGNVTVHLKGVGKTYKISKEELEGANELSSGDLDVRAIEIAVRKYIFEGNTHYSDLNHGFNPGDAYNIILGKGKPNPISYAFEALVGRDNDELIKNIKAGKIIATAYTSEGKNIETSLTNKQNDKDDIVIYHAYSIVNADENYIYLVNPWDTSEVLKMTHEDFQETFDFVDTLDVDELEE